MCTDETRTCCEGAALDGQLAALRQALLDRGVPVSGRLDPHVTVNRRAKRRLGCCRYQNGTFSIEVAERLLERPEQLRETLLHELLHTCPGCRDHGARWKAWAELVNREMGTGIARLAREEGPVGPLRHEEVKYKIRCERCGREYLRVRMCKLVKAPWRYRCSCGGKLKRVL